MTSTVIRKTQITDVTKQNRAARRRTQRGASMSEFGILAGLIAVVAIGGVVVLGQKTSSEFCGAASKVDTANGGSGVIDCDTFETVPGGGAGAGAGGQQEANAAPAFTGSSDLGAVAFATAPAVSVAATDPEGGVVSYALDPDSQAAYPWLSVDALTGAVSVNPALIDTVAVFDAAANNEPSATFIVTASDNHPGDPLTATQSFTLDLGLAADCDAMLAAIPSLGDGPQAIDPRLIDANASGMVRTFCDVDATGGAPVAWTMAAVFPADASGARRFVSAGSTTGPDGEDPAKLNTNSAVGVLTLATQTTAAKLSDQDWAILGDITRISTLDPSLVSDTGFTAGTSPTYLRYGADQAWRADQSYLNAAATPGASDDFVNGSNRYANPAPICSTDAMKWDSGIGVQNGDCRFVGSTTFRNGWMLTSMPTARAPGSTTFAFSNDPAGGVAFVRHTGQPTTNLPPARLIDSEAGAVLFRGVAQVPLAFDMNAYIADPEGGALTWSQSASTLLVLGQDGILDVTMNASFIAPFNFRVNANDPAGQTTSVLLHAQGRPVAGNLQSCDALYNEAADAGVLGNLATTDFLATIDKDGAGPQAAQRVACHFETSGPLEGGWTIVAYQRDNNPVTWDSASLATQRPIPTYFDTSFTMTDAQIPPHGHTAFGRKFFAAPNAVEIVDAVSLIYNTGPINVTGVDFRVGEKTGKQYQIHRSPTLAWTAHDPENESFSTTEGERWSNTLTFDEKTNNAISAYTWAFSPHAPLQGRGFSYLGSVGLTTENFAWVVMVR